jgi:hypothetical protein
MRKSGVWHPEAISTAAQELLKALGATPYLSRFYLAGGTGLALRFGHRRSADFDFFTSEEFATERLLASVREGFKPSVLSQAPQTLHLLLLGIKVSFIGYPYPLLFPTDRFSDVGVADARDIACMKLSAVSSPGTRRDLIDLYVAANASSLREILSLFEGKFVGIDNNRLHLLKSLTYFDDAESDPPLDMATEISWSDVKTFFVREATALM